MPFALQSALRQVASIRGWQRVVPEHPRQDLCNMMLKRSLLKPKYWIGLLMEWHGLTEGITILVKQQCTTIAFLGVESFSNTCISKHPKRIGHGRPFHLSKEERREMRWWPVTCERWRWILCSSSTVEFIWAIWIHMSDDLNLGWRILLVSGHRMPKPCKAMGNLKSDTPS